MVILLTSLYNIPNGLRRKCSVSWLTRAYNKIKNNIFFKNNLKCTHRDVVVDALGPTVQVD